MLVFDVFVMMLKIFCYDAQTMRGRKRSQAEIGPKSFSICVTGMDFNPWEVENLDEFLFYCCPECDTTFVSKPNFIEHALQNHPSAQNTKTNLDFRNKIGIIEGSVTSVTNDTVSESNGLSICDTVESTFEHQSAITYQNSSSESETLVTCHSDIIDTFDTNPNIDTFEEAVWTQFPSLFLVQITMHSAM